MSIFLIGWLPNFGQPASKDTCTVFKHSSSLFICIFFFWRICSSHRFTFIY